MNVSEDRKYSIAELDKLRKIARQSVPEHMLSLYSYDKEFIIVETRLQTYLLAGLRPEDFDES